MLEEPEEEQEEEEEEEEEEEWMPQRSQCSLLRHRSRPLPLQCLLRLLRPYKLRAG